MIGLTDPAQALLGIFIMLAALAPAIKSRFRPEGVEEDDDEA